MDVQGDDLDPEGLRPLPRCVQQRDGVAAAARGHGDDAARGHGLDQRSVVSAKRP
jgi:hypothetical protein